MTQANPAITIDSDAPVIASAPSTFFERTACYVTIFSMCSAVAMELAAGIAFHRAARLWAEMPSNAKDLREKHEELECCRIPELAPCRRGLEAGTAGICKPFLGQLPRSKAARQ